MLLTRAAVSALGRRAGLSRVASSSFPATNSSASVASHFRRRLSVMASHVAGDGGGANTAAVAVAGAVAGVALAVDQSQAQWKESETVKTALNPKQFVSFKLEDVETLNHNTKLFRFLIPEGTELGMPVASCVLTRAQVVDAAGNSEVVVRPYTPVSDPDQKGYFELLIKVYPQGKMTQFMDKLVPGDSLDVKGPLPKIKYTPNMKKRIGMIAGGSGITPMYQVLNCIAKNPEDNTQVTLVFANVTESDILLRKELDGIAFSHPNIKVYYVLDRATKGWEGGVGYITPDMLVKALPPPSDDNLIMVCGPPGMMRHISGDKAPDKSQGELSGLLKQLGYTKEQVFKF